VYWRIAKELLSAIGILSRTPDGWPTLPALQMGYAPLNLFPPYRKKVGVAVDVLSGNKPEWDTGGPKIPMAD
jgi:hypothetical protein